MTAFAASEPLFGLFFVIILALQFGVNYTASAMKCGSPQMGYALWYTIFPNLIYTGVVILLLFLLGHHLPVGWVLLVQQCF